MNYQNVGETGKGDFYYLNKTGIGSFRAKIAMNVV